MTEYILLMHDDVAHDVNVSEWGPYLGKLRSTGLLRGGSAMGSGICVRREGPVPPITNHLAGFIRIEARDLNHARDLLEGNPVYETGDTIEIRDLPRSD